MRWRRAPCEATVAVSLFLVNRRPPVEEAGREDEGSIFQAELVVEGEAPFVPRADLTGHGADDIDARIADLHYRDVVEWAVGHNVSVTAEPEAGSCRRVRTAWLPEAYVPRVVPSDIEGVTLDMEALGALAEGAAARSALGRLPELYEAWIAAQGGGLPGLSTPIIPATSCSAAATGHARSCGSRACRSSPWTSRSTAGCRRS